MVEYTIDYEVYSVSERYGSEDEDWYEYEVTLNKNGEEVDRWDSYGETYNGVKGQRLSKKEAKDAAEEIKEDIEENGTEPDEWGFDV